MRAHKLTTVIQLPEYESIYTIEDQIKEYKSIKNQIDILEIQLKQLREGLFKDYFDNNTEYKNKFGQVIARRIDCESTYFNQSEFKKDHKDVYDLYSKKVSQVRFTVK